VRNYIDDIDFLRKTSYKKFWPLKTDIDENLNIEEFRNHITSYWAVSYAIAKCLDDPTRDPLEILDDEANTYQIESIFGKQELNKRNYQVAYQAIDNMRDKLLKRRKMRE